MRIEEAYVAGWRAARPAAERWGLLDRLERATSRSAAHIRSLFAIHDVTDMIALDLAWWSYAAIDAVAEHLAGRSGHARVFEYGAGASTVWLSRRSGQVISVEHDAGFYQFLQPLIGPLPHVDLRLVGAVASDAPSTPSRRRGYAGMDFSNYVSTIDACDGEFDLVVVDGRARVASVRRALPRLSPGGMLLLDNASRSEYRAVVDDPAIDVRVLRGATPCLPYPTSTALIRRR